MKNDQPLCCEECADLRERLKAQTELTTAWHQNAVRAGYLVISIDQVDEAGVKRMASRLSRQLPRSKDQMRQLCESLVRDYMNTVKR